jgi:hypothetical protein
MSVELTDMVSCVVEIAAATMALITMLLRAGGVHQLYDG